MQNNSLLNCVIVDDEPLASEGLRRQLKLVDSLNISATFNDPIEASSFLEANKIDIVFLDVNMPHLNGLQLLTSLSSKPLVIFTTAHPNHALEAFKMDAVDYLLKPFSFENLVKAINKATLMLKVKTHKQTTEHIFIRSDGSYHRLNFNEIVYIEGMKDYVKVKTRDEILTVAMNLSTIFDKLPAKLFTRVHKSYIVNKSKITRFDGSELMLDSVRIPIGPAYRETLKQEVLANLPASR